MSQFSPEFLAFTRELGKRTAAIEAEQRNTKEILATLDSALVDPRRDPRSIEVEPIWRAALTVVGIDRSHLCADEEWARRHAAGLTCEPGRRLTQALKVAAYARAKGLQDPVPLDDFVNLLEPTGVLSGDGFGKQSPEPNEPAKVRDAAAMPTRSHVSARAECTQRDVTPDGSAPLLESCRSNGRAESVTEQHQRKVVEALAKLGHVDPHALPAYEHGHQPCQIRSAVRNQLRALGDSAFKRAWEAATSRKASNPVGLVHKSAQKQCR
ncbi:hypothetical protein [Ideonella sp.]|uniref:hypothetical protein n=1 Tax=Ideonella sp. TaxID=1929293 RepID=UPI003BB50574